MKALVALAIVVAGAIAAFAVYTFAPNDEAESTETAGAPGVYTLRQGDIVRMPSAARPVGPRGQTP